MRRCSWWVPAVTGANCFFFCPDALPCVRRCNWWVPAVRGANRVFFCPDALPCVRRCSWWVPAVRGANRFFFCPDALPCVRRCSWWVPAVRGECFFCEIRWPIRRVPAVRWRNHYFPHNKEALPCCGRGPSCQPLHVQYTSDGSRSLTMLTTPRSVACMRPWAWCVPTVNLSRTVMFR